MVTGLVSNSQKTAGSRPLQLFPVLRYLTYEQMFIPLPLHLCMCGKLKALFDVELIFFPIKC